MPILSRFLRGATAVLAGAVVVQTASAAIFKSRPCDVPQLRDAILQQVNALRAQGARCGFQNVPAAQALGWSERLRGAATVHSADMAERDYFDHQAPDGRRARERVDATGYRWRSVGENLAAGNTTVPEVMEAWMQSPDHCRNIMEPAYQEVAVACVQRPGTTYGTYWTMVLGRPR